MKLLFVLSATEPSDGLIR